MTTDANRLTSGAIRTSRATPTSAAPALGTPPASGAGPASGSRPTSPAASAPPGMVPTLPATSVRPLLEALERLGHDGTALLAATRLTRSQLADPDGRVPCTACAMLIEAAQRERPRANLALHVAAATPIGAHPLIDYLVLSSHTVGEGLRRLSRYYRLVGAQTPLELHENEDPIRVAIDWGGNGFIVEYTVALALLHLRAETNGSARAGVASFTHRPDDPAEFERMLGCEVRVGASWSGYTLSRPTWQLPMRRRDPVLLGLLERQAEEAISSLPASETLSFRVRRALAVGLTDGDASIDAIARTLAMSPRTLQRRLASEGATFQQLLDVVRRETAERHLKGSVFSIGEIAFVLGYSEPAAFHRAFRRWNGTTPQAFRAG